MTALLWAASYEYFPMIKWLLQKGEANVADTDTYGETLWNKLTADNLRTHQDVLMAMLTRQAPPSWFSSRQLWMEPFVAEADIVRRRRPQDSQWQRDQRRKVHNEHIATNQLADLVLEYAQPTEEDLWALASMEALDETGRRICEVSERFLAEHRFLNVTVYYLGEAQEERVQRRNVVIDSGDFGSDIDRLHDTTRLHIDNSHGTRLFIRGNLVHIDKTDIYEVARLLPKDSVIIGAKFLTRERKHLMALNNDKVVDALEARWGRKKETLSARKKRRS
jgi:hypothetical protein